jgi:hypothetical protein
VRGRRRGLRFLFGTFPPLFIGVLLLSFFIVNAHFGNVYGSDANGPFAWPP